jgi:hypothetical protein
MSKATSKQNKAPKKLAEMRAEYDLAGMGDGVRGKYYQDYRAGHTVKIHREDGTTVVQHFDLEDGTVMLEPDVREYFPDSAAVNAALRCLIPLMPKKRKTKAKA